MMKCDNLNFRVFLYALVSIRVLMIGGYSEGLRSLRESQPIVKCQISNELHLQGCGHYFYIMFASMTTLTSIGSYTYVC